MANPYIGRTVDILAYQGGSEYGQVQLFPALSAAGQSGKVCTGLQKLAQRFIIEFLTAKGTMLYQPDRGTPFMIKASQGQLRTVADVRSAFAEAMIDCYQNLTTAESGSEPDDERYAGAELTSVNVALGSISLNINLYSKAGTAAKFIVPISTSLGRN